MIDDSAEVVPNVVPHTRRAGEDRFPRAAWEPGESCRVEREVSISSGKMDQDQPTKIPSVRVPPPKGSRIWPPVGSLVLPLVNPVPG